MFRVTPRKKTPLSAALEIADVTYHATVRAARGSHSNALFGLVINVATTALFIVILYVTMTLMGFVSNAFRGDFVVFLMSGVMSYMTYNKTMKAVYGAEGPTSAMMLHAPMNTAVAIMSAALSALYLQILSAVVILFVYHVAFVPVTINDPVHALSLILGCWLFGIGTGMVLLAIKPWAPKLAPMLMMIVSRINIFASGKMLVGNALSFTLLKFFDWNPLFHLIDQLRGAIFINYVPRNSSLSYALWVSVVLIALGLMGEFFTRKHTSRSWFAR
jgi:ABC-type polysaccharide/polyol phosphate export permease